MAPNPRGHRHLHFSILLAIVSLGSLVLIPELRMLSVEADVEQQHTAQLLQAAAAHYTGDGLPLAGDGGAGQQQRQRLHLEGASQQQQEPREQRELAEQTNIPPDFKFERVVAIIAWDRFAYFKQVIQALLGAWGSEHYLLTITIDGPLPDTAAANDTSANATSSSPRFDRAGWENIVAYSKQLQWLARNQRTGFRDVLVNVAHTNLGCWPNKKRAVAWAMELSDFAVILEDDVTLERDGLRWMEWPVTSGLIFRQPQVATATCFASAFPLDSGAPVEGYDLVAVRTLGLLDKYYLMPYAYQWGWALWKRSWQAVGANWTGQDVNLVKLILQQGWTQAVPLVSRCNNIGAFGYHKQGAETRHVHQRAVTSGFFPRLDTCRYTQVHIDPNATDRILPFMRDYVRTGLRADRHFLHLGLNQYRRWLRKNASKLLPPNHQSTC